MHSQDLTGQTFSKWTVIKRSENSKYSRVQFLCRCECGNEKIIDAGNLRHNKSKSCGCSGSRTTMRERFTTHGMRRSRIYSIWTNMINRCENHKVKSYKDYGARGITVCERWHKFADFFADMGEPPTSQHSIDRLDNNQGYYKENCRWATKQEQANNTRRSRIIEFNGHKKTLSQWAKSLNINTESMRLRLSRWPLDRALTTPAPR